MRASAEDAGRWRVGGGERVMEREGLIERALEKLGPLIEVTGVVMIAFVLLAFWIPVIFFLAGVVEKLTVLFAPFCDVILQYLENTLAEL
jgi:hypothetical protein